jgi:hypothetical protein
MKQCSQKPSTHNLNIHMYSLKEILGLFNLPYQFSQEDLKRAKLQVLKLHPDKSRLPADYFLFYKKAYEIVYQYYQNENKQNQKITDETTKYQPIYANDHNKATTNKITSVITEMSPNDFQNKFNQLFEENMANKQTNKNEWFSKEEPIYNVQEKVASKDMGRVFDSVKQQQSSLIRYRGVQEMVGNTGSRLYDEDDDNDETPDYISCDLFNKLKFDDIRKVHKDQTVFAVSEKDFANMPKYSSMDQYKRERGNQTLAPLEKESAEQLLYAKDKQYREYILQKEHSANIRSMEYAEKNKTVLSSFLHLTNG